MKAAYDWKREQARLEARVAFVARARRVSAEIAAVAR